MSICNPCAKAANIYQCVDSIIIGEGDPSTNYKVLLTSITSGVRIFVDVTTGVDGIIQIDPELAPINHTIRITILEDGEQVNWNAWNGTAYISDVSCVDLIVEAAREAIAIQKIKV